MQRRPPPATRRTAGPDPVEGLARGARRRRRRRSRVDARIIVGALVLIAIAATLAVVIRLGSEAASPVRENSVAEISGRVADALDSAGLSASYTRTAPGPDGSEAVAYQVMRNSSGSFLVNREDGRRAASYDASTGTRWERTMALDGTVLLTQETSTAAGPPDPSGSDPALPDAELGAALRALATVTDREAEAARVGGRAVWRLEASLDATGENEANRVVLVVDQVRLAPVSVDLTDGGRPVSSLRFTDVTFGAVAPGGLRVDTTGAEPQTVDHGFRRVTLREAADAVGNRPLRPTYLPAGFVLVDSTLHDEDAIVSLRYQRGVQQVVVTTRRATASAGADPFVRAEPVEPRSVSIERGPFRDVEARYTMTVTPKPALWGQNAEIALTVSGDLTSAQLLRVAESMQ